MAVADAFIGPRERAIDVGLDALGDTDLVAIVLGTGQPGEPVSVLAASLVAEHGGVAGLGRAGMGELAARAGVGRAKGARLAAAIELGRRAAFASSRGPELEMPNARAVDAWARPRIAAMDHEELWLLALDGRNGLRAARRVASGGLHGLHVSARDPLRHALREGASGFVLVHNHPSGDPAPSDEDVTFSRALLQASTLVGTPLIDHVVVARRGFASMLEQGMLGPPLPETVHPPVARTGRRSKSSSAGRA
jgi:DNA repair protein RadC